MEEPKKKMGRKRFGTNKRYTVGIVMDPDLHERLKAEAQGIGESVSLVACEAIDKLLTEREKTRSMFGM